MRLFEFIEQVTTRMAQQNNNEKKKKKEEKRNRTKPPFVCMCVCAWEKIENKKNDIRVSPGIMRVGAPMLLRPFVESLIQFRC